MTTMAKNSILAMTRAPGCEKSALKKGAWSPEEDQKLIAYIRRYGIWIWNRMPKPAGLARSGKSCRLRWVNYLRPNIKHGNFTKEEKETIHKLHDSLGNRWSAIAANLPRRTDNEIKNYWHSHLKKQLINNNPMPNTKSAAAAKTCISEATQMDCHETNLVVVPSASTPDVSGDMIIPLAPHLSTGDYSSSNTDTGAEINENQTIEGYNPYWMEELYTVEDSWATFADLSSPLWFPDPIYQFSSYDNRAPTFGSV